MLSAPSALLFWTKSLFLLSPFSAGSVVLTFLLAWKQPHPSIESGLLGSAWSAGISTLSKCSFFLPFCWLFFGIRCSYAVSFFFSFPWKTVPLPWLFLKFIFMNPFFPSFPPPLYCFLSLSFCLSQFVCFIIWPVCIFHELTESLPYSMILWFYDIVSSNISSYFWGGFCKDDAKHHLCAPLTGLFSSYLSESD